MSDQSTAVAVGETRALGVRLGPVVEGMWRIYGQPGVQRALPTIVGVLVVLAGLALYAALQAPARTTLFASLPEAEKSRVMEVLRNNGTDVQVDPVSGEITVPVDAYHSSRMSLAAQGLPTSLPNGYSVLDDMPMGTSRSVESMRLKQTQEIELARSITEIDAIEAARVHLAIPERSAFARNAQEPTASVFLQMREGRTLTSNQVSAIVNLVSNSVPNLPKSGISVVDQNGRLLSDSIDDPAATLADRQLEYRMRLEQIYKSRIESLLTPIAGPGNVSTQVSLDIDFTLREMTEDLVLPDATALVSEQNTLEQDILQRAVGIPGAIRNTPPPQAGLEEPGANINNAGVAPDVQANQPPGTGDQRQDETPVVRSSNELRNYEVSRKVYSEKAPVAQIKRIQVAVLLKQEPQSGGAAPEESGWSDAERAEIIMLVQRSVGIDETRGDTVEVISRPFVSTVTGAVSAPWWEDPWIREIARSTLMLLVIAVIVLGVVRPLLSRMLAASTESQQASARLDELDAEMDTIQVQEGQTLEDIKARLKPKKAGISAEMLDTANSYDDKVAIIRMIVADEAGRVSNVFKTMMQEDMEHGA